MNIQRVFVLLVLSVFSSTVMGQFRPIGQWREHLEFGPANEIEFAEDRFYVASKWGIYSVSYEDRSIERYSKLTGLSDLGIQTIKYNPSSEKLLIAYNNSNLDVLYRNDIINIPYIKKSNVNGNKTINQIQIEGPNAYLSTGLGVIVVNLNKYEISTTWPMGSNGNPTNVTAMTFDLNHFYVSTNAGILKISRQNKFPENYGSWELITQNNGFPSGTPKNIFLENNTLYAQINNQLLKLNGGQWLEVYRDEWEWVNTQAGDNKIYITQQKNNYAEKRVVILNTTNSNIEIVQDDNLLSNPMQTKSYDNSLYVADNRNGVIIQNSESTETIKINSPYGTLDGEMIFQNNKLYVAGGSINEAWFYKENRSGFFVFDDNRWKSYNVRTLPWMDTLTDIITIAVDPLDETIYAGSYSGRIYLPDGRYYNGGGGLIEFKDENNYKIYKQNSAIEIFGDLSYRVSGLAFDNERNLWFSNFGGERNFGVKKADGSWAKFNVPFIINDNMVGGILIDDYNQKWIQVPQGNGIYCYNHGASIDNPNDDRWKWFQTGRGNGNLPGNLVQAMAKDKDGFIWLGTDKGIGIIQCPGEVFTANGCESFQPVVQQDNFAGLLFANEEIKAIAVDGGNRKWVGSKNGVWLISPDGEKVIERFTEENSPLLSNEINRIAIDPNSGEVYFSTFKGICSYRGTSTEGGMKNDSVFVFPNPVPSGYGGKIGIRGLTANAYVKIMEPNGRLVYQTQAFGGQAVWDGKDYKGRRVATGVYLILVTDPLGVEKISGKIVFIK
jgi:sugar lactone lactonase YvrE